ncbi:MAG: hypothetical protein AAGG72_07680, partial [Pseudomonadota bacterium]
MIDGDLPRYVVEACQEDDRVRLTANRRGRITKERRIGRCGPPPVPEDYSVLSSVRLNGVRDRVVIRVGRDAGRFDALRFRVHGNDLALRRIVVRYRNGDRQRMRVRGALRGDAVSQTFEL